MANLNIQLRYDMSHWSSFAPLRALVVSGSLGIHPTGGIQLRVPSYPTLTIRLEIDVVEHAQAAVAQICQQSPLLVQTCNPLGMCSAVLHHMTDFEAESVRSNSPVIMKVPYT